LLLTTLPSSPLNTTTTTTTTTIQQQGALQTNKQIKIDIPAGVQDGTKLRIKGACLIFGCHGVP
jgi:DnaJ-class molecular chaperone